MKFITIKSLGFLSLLTILSSVCFAGQDQNIARANDRMYIDVESVLIATNGIFAKIEGSLYSFTTLSTDSNGMYVEGILDEYASPARCLTCDRVFDDTKQNPWCPHDYKRKK